MLSMDRHNCSIRKRFNDIDLKTKTKYVKNLLNFFPSVYFGQDVLNCYTVETSIQILFDGFKHRNMRYFLWPMKSNLKKRQSNTRNRYSVTVGYYSVSQPTVLFYSKFRTRIVVYQVCLCNHKCTSKDGDECVRKVTQ